MRLLLKLVFKLYSLIGRWLVTDFLVNCFLFFLGNFLWVAWTGVLHKVSSLFNLLSKARVGIRVTLVAKNIKRTGMCLCQIDVGKRPQLGNSGD